MRWEDHLTQELETSLGNTARPCLKNKRNNNKKPQKECPYDPAAPLMGIYPKEMKSL
jgi:hypothetical protein